MHTFDKYDLKLLDALDRDGRQSLSSVARSVRLGRDLVDYRIRKLIEQGTITAVRGLVDPWRQGFQVFKTFLKLRSHPRRIEKFYHSLLTHPHVYWCALCDGAWDLFFTCIERTPTAFSKTQRSILKPYSDLILEQEIALNVDFQIYSRGYFSNEPSKTFHLGGEQHHRDLSPFEQTLLRELSVNGRVTATELAEISESSPSIVRAHIHKLEQEKLLVGYKLDVNLKHFGRTFYKVRLSFSCFTESLEKKFAAYCQQDAEIVYLVIQIGSCPVEISVEATSYEHLQLVLHRLRAEFGEELTRIETLLVRDPTHRWGR